MVCLWQSANQNSNVSLQFISIYHSRSRVLFSRGSSLCIYYVSSDWTGQGADYFLNRCIFRLLHDYLTGRCSGHFHTICLGHQSLRTRHPLLATASRRQRRRRDVPTSLWIARQQEWQEWQQECISYHFDTFSYSMSFCFLCGGM